MMRVVRRLSEAYCNQYILAREPTCMPPWAQEDDIQAQRKAVAAQFKRFIARAKNGG